MDEYMSDAEDYDHEAVSAELVDALRTYAEALDTAMDMTGEDPIGRQAILQTLRDNDPAPVDEDALVEVVTALQTEVAMVWVVLSQLSLMLQGLAMPVVVDGVLTWKVTA